MVFIPTPTVEINVANQGMSKGLLNEEGVQVIGNVRFDLSHHLYARGQFKNVDNGSNEAQAAVGAHTSVAGFELTGEAAYKRLMDAPVGYDNEALELTATVAHKVGPATLAISAVASPNDFGLVGRSLYVEANASLPVRKGTSLSGGVGHRSRDNATDYTSFNAGVTQTLSKNIAVDVRYYDTAENSYGRAFRNRVIAALKFKF